VRGQDVIRWPAARNPAGTRPDRAQHGGPARPVCVNGSYCRTRRLSRSGCLCRSASAGA